MRSTAQILMVEKVPAMPQCGMEVTSGRELRAGVRGVEMTRVRA